MAWYPLFAHAQVIPEILCELVRLWTSYTWLLCGEITKLDIRLAVWHCIYAAMASIIRDTRGNTTRTTVQPPPVPPSLCLYLNSLASQTQPTPARIAFSVTSFTVRDTESDPRWGWLGLACKTSC